MMSLTIYGVRRAWAKFVCTQVHPTRPYDDAAPMVAAVCYRKGPLPFEIEATDTYMDEASEGMLGTI